MIRIVCILLRKEPWNWDKAAEEAFRVTKQTLASMDALVHYDLKRFSILPNILHSLLTRVIVYMDHNVRQKSSNNSMKLAFPHTKMGLSGKMGFSINTAYVADRFLRSAQHVHKSSKCQQHS